ncbi:D-inositol 3-phosphate glycosyltransferase [compost metagenome]
MKLLYIVPSINNEGGVARVLSAKADYLIEKKGYEVHILTQNNGNFPLFFFFNSKIILHDMILKGKMIKFFLNYVKELNGYCKTINPDLIIVSDNGFKGYFVPMLLGKKIPIIFESHGSKYIEEKELESGFISKLITAVKLSLKEFGGKKFNSFVALSNESLKEWKLDNGIVIPNPLVTKSKIQSNLASKKIIAVGRHSYEKGLDRLLEIWQKVIVKHPDWILEIYGTANPEFDLEQFASKFQISDSIRFCNPVKDIEEKFTTASLLAMTSRTEGFGLVLIEAMASGLPCIAYDCPVGPRSIIKDEENGFLIEDGNIDLFVEKLSLLIENEDIRKRLGEKAQISGANYDLDAIMKQWQNLFESLLENKKLR